MCFRFGDTYSNNPQDLQKIINYEPGLIAQAAAKHINEIQKFFVEETRLGIPIIPFDEALHGLIRRGSTIFPQSIALATTFDTTIMREVSTAISNECKSRGIRQILSPVVNLATDPRWGRVEETYNDFSITGATAAGSYVLEVSGDLTNGNYTISTRNTGTWIVSQATGAELSGEPTLNSTTESSITVDVLTLPLNSGGLRVNLAMTQSSKRLLIQSSFSFHKLGFRGNKSSYGFS